MKWPKHIKLVRRTLVTPTQLVPPNDLNKRDTLIWLRNQAIYATFDELYENQRRRFDDVVLELEAIFFLAERSIMDILSARPVQPPQVAAAPGEQATLPL